MMVMDLLYNGSRGTSRNLSSVIVFKIFYTPLENRFMVKIFGQLNSKKTVGGIQIQCPQLIKCLAAGFFAPLEVCPALR
jgi:hypothetical protein